MSGTGAWESAAARLSSYVGGSGNTYDMEPEREPGARRKKLAGYLKAANELRQTYQQSYMQGVGKDGSDDFAEPIPGAYPSAAVGRTGEEEMILFPSYATRRQKHTSNAPQTSSAQSWQNQRERPDANDVEFLQQDLRPRDDENAIVDVDVRGWIYIPHKGPMNRKTRLFVGLARQLVGIPAPAGKSPTASAPNSRSSSPHGLRERAEAKAAKHEEAIVAKEAESIARKGEAEESIAGLGGYSERPGDDDTGSAVDRRDSDTSVEKKANMDRSEGNSLSRTTTSSQSDESRISPVQKRSSWIEPTQMSEEQLNTANSHLMRRVKPFLANPLANTPISAFFYNDKLSRQKTVDTNAYGHFTLRAALDFIPTHVRILANEYLSATQDVIITEPKGVSVISDIDDTIKHSGIGSGAREIFRNAFIRELEDLNIQGVKEWYNRMADMGAKFHYVSNSPWQLYPVLTTFFRVVGLPQGSFHLKQYNGMLQGIFEPVAERKKGTLEKLLRDFPNRRFILVGDSGEADLEVYTDLVMEHPGRILGVFIRDITTPEQQGFFDSSVGPPGNGSSRNGTSSDSSWNRQDAGAAQGRAKVNGSRPNNQSSSNRTGTALSTSNSTDSEQRPALPPRRKTAPPAEEEDLIDLNWDDNKPVNPPKLERSSSDKDVMKSAPPPRPAKPKELTTESQFDQPGSASSEKIRPPKPRKPSTTVNTNVSAAGSQEESSTQQAGDSTKPKKPPPPQSYRSAARQTLVAAYNHLPAAPTSWHRTPVSPSANPPQPPPKPLQKSASLPPENNGDRPPPVPPRKPVASTAAQYATSLYNAASAATPSPSQLKPPSSLLTQRPPAGPNRANSYAFSSSSASGYAGAANKKEDLWKRRWARSKQLLDEQGVMLRAWRVGRDVEEVALELMERAEGDEEARR